MHCHIFLQLLLDLAFDCYICLFAAWVMCITWVSLSCTDPVLVIWSQCWKCWFVIFLSLTNHYPFVRWHITIWPNRHRLHHHCRHHHHHHHHLNRVTYDHVRLGQAKTLVTSAERGTLVWGSDKTKEDLDRWAAESISTEEADPSPSPASSSSSPTSTQYDHRLINDF